MTNPDRRNHAGPGQTLGRYRLRGVLGQGGMGRLYVAEQRGIQGFTKIVCLKQILPHLADNPQFRKMFLSEARVAARLDHPHIVVTYELGEVDGVYFMAMEYLPGEDLGAVLARCRDSSAMPIEVAAGTAHQALSGLQYAHELRDSSGRPTGLVHRDVNPSNIFVTYYGVVKLLDFGVVKGATTAGTSPGLFKGKYGYCAPEQLEGDGIDPRTDLFCVGIVLWECLTGQRLFKGNTDAAVIDAVRVQAIAAPSSVRPGVPSELDEITMRALSRNRNQRYRSAFEMAEALDRFLSRRPQRPTTKTMGQWLESIFGAGRAELKKAIAQGNDIESSLAQLAAMGGLLTAPPSQASSARRSGPSMQPRSLWSTSVRKPGSEPGATAHGSTTPPPPSRDDFIAFGEDGEGRPGDVPTSRFAIPQALAEAAGITQVTNPPTTSSDPVPVSVARTSTVGPRPSGGKSMKVIAVVGALGAATLAFLALRDDGSSTVPASSVQVKVATLELGSDPAGAHLLIDGEPTGLVTPTVLQNLRPGKVLEIRLDKPGYQTAVHKLTINPETNRLHHKLVAAGGVLALQGLPERASVYVDDVLTDVQGPISVPLGARKLRVEREGEVVFERVVEVRAGELTINLRPGKGR